MNLQGKVAIVTGGNSGIGAAIVSAYAKAGASVVIDYVINPDATMALEKTLLALGEKVIGIDADISTIAGLQALIDKAVETYGHLDIIVNNAGIETRTSVLDTTETEYDKVMAVNLKSAFFGTKLAAQQFIQQGTPGVVINTSSIHEDVPMSGNTPYSVSKGGMRMLARSAGVELAKYKIRVVNICPGAVMTPINASEMNASAQAALNKVIPLGRMAAPEEIAKVAVFLASDDASYITATSLDIDGGMMEQNPGL